VFATRQTTEVPGYRRHVAREHVLGHPMLVTS
jgi:hypothetical protein